MNICPGDESKPSGSCEVSQPSGTARDDSLEHCLKSGYNAIRSAVISANSLPEGRERDDYLKEEDFRRLMKNESNHILDVMQMVVNLLGKGMKIRDCTNEDKSELVVDLNDMLLDRSSLNMDVLEGIRDAESVASSLNSMGLMTNGRNAVSGLGIRGGGGRYQGYHNQRYERSNHQVQNQPQPNRQGDRHHGQEQHGSWNNRGRDSRQETGRKLSPPTTPTLHTMKINSRPQLFFKEKVDNSNSPWCPRLKDKPNSLKPLAFLVENNDDGEECYSHPYEFELDRWEPSEERLQMMKPTQPQNVKESPFSFVENEGHLTKMLEELKSKSEIAVDLEHHSYRSFMGFTCLMQISTNQKDYIIDTLNLRSELHVLNEIFTNPKVLKVFHGSENDIEWLQRDLSLYIVNMFDTHQAAKLLDFPKLNLAHLLSYYCGIDANKHFQLYDWRTRPLPENAIKYAREDTHYLLYIYKMMNNELLKKAQGNTNLLKSVYHRSVEICKRRYMKPILDEDSHMLLYRKGKRLFDNRQLYALKELYRWRDRTARELDESIGYVLPTHMMMQICETLPREVQGILACCNPIPPVVRQSLHEIHYMLLAARDQPLVKEIKDSGSSGLCIDRHGGGGGGNGVHRLSSGRWDFGSGCGRGETDDDYSLRDDLPTLLGSGLPLPPPGPVVVPQIPLGRRQGEEGGEDEEENSKKIMSRLLEIENRMFMNPYQRYKLVLPFVNQMEVEQKEREEKEYEELKKKEKQQLVEKNESLLKQKVIKFETPVRSTLPLSKQPGVGSRKSLQSPGVGKIEEVKPQPSHQETTMGKVGNVKVASGSNPNRVSTLAKSEIDNNAPGVSIKKEKTIKTIPDVMKLELSVGKGIDEKLPSSSMSALNKKINKKSKNSIKREKRKALLLRTQSEPQQGVGVITLDIDTTGQGRREEDYQGRNWGRQPGGQQMPQNRQGNRMNQMQPFAPYNYSDVDFNKFHSGGGKIPLDNQNMNRSNRGKRKQQLGGKHYVGSNKRRR